jgi:hypothetical protein
MAGKAHRREFRKARTAYRLARRRGEGSLAAQGYEQRLRELGYSFDPWKKKYVRGRSL